MEVILGLIKLTRPKQWIKNFFVFSAIIFSGRLVEKNIILNNIYTFILFCLISSSVYVLNDIVDVNKDRCHPEKKKRPIASGKVSILIASIFEIMLLSIVFLCSYFYNKNILYILFLYYILNVFYSFKLKNIVILDVMTITIGFVLRVESGSFASNVNLSPWLILCTILLALFLAINKRKSEILMLKGNSENHRKILREYSIELLDKMLQIVTPCILMAYCLYTFKSTQSNFMMITIPFVLYGIFRYEYLMKKENIGGKPEDIFQKDKPFLINILLWCVSVICIIYFKL